MPSHLREIDSSCDVPTCTKRATVQLFDTFNTLMGKFCKQHGNGRLAARRKLEDLGEY